MDARLGGPAPEPDRNLALELVRATEATAMAAARHLGYGDKEAVDQAAVDGTTLTAKSLPNAIAVVALAERGTMFDPGPCVYMEKLAVGRDVADAVDFEARSRRTCAGSPPPRAWRSPS